MSEKELGEALNAIYELEKESFQTMQLEQELLAESKRFAVPKKVPEPVFRPSHFGNDRNLFFFTIGGVVCGALLFFLCCIAMDVEFESGGFLLLGIPVFIGLMVFGAWLGSEIGYWLDMRIHKKEVERERETWATNSPELVKYRVALEAEGSRLEREKVIVDEILNERSGLLALRDRESRTLSQLYESAGIGADYRKLIPMRYMANFFNLGISRKLEGTDGLYYLVRQELRADQFNASLQEISSKMDTIISKQSEIYQELLHIEEQNRKIIRELENGFSSVSSAVSSAAKDVRKSGDSGVARYVGDCVARQNDYLFLASRWGF